MVYYLTNRAIGIVFTAEIPNFRKSNKMAAGTCVIVKIAQLVCVTDWNANYRVLCIYYVCLIVGNIIREHLPNLEKPTFLLHDL